MNPLLTVLVIAALTFLTRVLPFILFPANRKTPGFIIYLGRVLPFSIMGMLVVYCFKDVSLVSRPWALPELIAASYVIGIHKWKHNMLLSIGGGTILYMFLIQWVFA